MKKVFTLFLLLLCVTTGWATNYKVASTFTPLSELTSGYYVIRVFSDKANTQNGSYLYATSSDQKVYNEAPNSTNSYEGNSTLDNAYYVWKVFVDEVDGNKTIQLQNVGKGLFIQKIAQGGDAMFSGDNIAVFYTEENDNTPNGFRLKTNGIYIICDGTPNSQTTVGKLGNWATTGSNCAQFRMFKVGIDVTYNFTLDGQTYTKQVTALGGETPRAAYDAFYTFPGYVQGSFPSETLTEEGTTTFNISCTKNADYPVTSNKWYFVKIGLQGGSSTRDGYLFDNGNAQIPTNRKTKNLADATYIWKFVGNPFDGYQLINGSGKRLITAAYGSGNASAISPFAATVNNTKACCDKWDVQGTSVVASASQSTYWSNKAFILSAHNHGNYQLHAYNTNVIGFWKSTSVDVSSAITLDVALPEITLNSLDGKNYATYYLPFAAKAPEGVTAYAGTINNGAVQLTEYENGVIPAKKGVVLVSDTKTTATFTLADESDVTTQDNELTGALTTTTLSSVENSEQVRIFSKKNDIAGFYKPNDNITSLAANKAYILAPINTNALVLNFAGEVTGINQAMTNAAETNAPIYDLTGRRVAKAVKGIYVQNGKKFIVK